jgi:succinylglutamate desuccinylase
MIERLQSSLEPDLSLDVVGGFNASNRHYPFYKIILGRGNLKRVLISAGIHGDEPAGIETIINFICNKLYQFHDWEITFLPCLNPYGYETDSRENFHNQDLNRLFKEETPPKDIQLIQSVYQSSFHLSIELHEDIDSPGYYLYQTADNDFYRQVGHKIIDDVEDVLPINKASEIEGIPSNKGVIDRPAKDASMTWWPMALYSASRGTALCLTLETPTAMPIQSRVQAHLTAIDCALKNFIKEGR